MRKRKNIRNFEINILGNTYEKNFFTDIFVFEL